MVHARAQTHTRARTHAHTHARTHARTCLCTYVRATLARTHHHTFSRVLIPLFGVCVCLGFCVWLVSGHVCILVFVQMPGAIRDLRSWLQLYGEPDPGKIPTGTMTTFTASKKHVGKDKSQTCQMSCKVCVCGAFVCVRVEIRHPRLITLAVSCTPLPRPSL